MIPHTKVRPIHISLNTRGRVVLTNLSSSASQEFPCTLCNPKIITVLTKASQFSLSCCPEPEQCSARFPNRYFTSILKSFSHLCLCLSRCLFPSFFLTKILSPPPMRYKQRPSHSPIYASVFQVVSFALVSPPKSCLLLPPCATSNAHLILPFMPRSFKLSLSFIFSPPKSCLLPPISFSHLCLGLSSCLFPSCFPTEILSPSPPMRHKQRPSHSPIYASVFQVISFPHVFPPKSCLFLPPCATSNAYLILPFITRSFKLSPSLMFSHQNLVSFSSPACATCNAHLIILDL